MNADNYQISKLPYIENASNEIMEKYNIKAQYETEPPHGDAIYSIFIKGKALPFWIYGRDVTFIGNSIIGAITYILLYIVITFIFNKNYLFTTKIKRRVL